MSKDKFKINLPEPNVKAQKVTSLNKIDLQKLCDATEEAIEHDGGFGWLKAPSREKIRRLLERCHLIPERILIVGKLDNILNWID